MNSTMKINDGLQNGLKMIHSIGKAMNYGCKCTGEIIEGVSALPAEGHKMLTNLVTKQEVPDIDDLSLKKTAEHIIEDVEDSLKDVADIAKETINKMKMSKTEKKEAEEEVIEETSKENEDSEPKDIKDEDVIDPLMA